MLRTYRQQGPAGFTGPNRSGLSELLWQIRNYLGFMWASGGLVQDYVAHNVDECCWMKGAWPVRAQGSGGRCHRGDNVDQNYDHYDVEYTFADGAKLFLYARNIVGCHGEFASYAHGTKGSAVISTHMHTPAKCRIYKGQDFAKDQRVWAFRQPEPNPYQLEWDELIEAIRHNKPYNEAQRGAEASLVTAMARRAVHTGQIVTYDEMLNCEEEFARDVDKLTVDSPVPVQAGADGRYPAPQPGLLKNREY
jgi:predicted dehydrogenase